MPAGSFTGREFSTGVIEGFFGEPWSWDARRDYADFLSAQDFAYYIYAPKQDPILRVEWRSDWDDATWEALLALRALYRERGVAFGVGLSPWRLHADYDASGAQDLVAKVRRIGALEPDIFAVLFDDMPVGVEALATTQARISMDALSASDASVRMVCPTFYCDDPVAEQLLGATPPGYLQDLSAGLDASVQIFWTGERICSKAYPSAHLADVTERLGRKPLLWDNYPVNDGPQMAKRLHLRAFENRGPELRESTVGLAANPMNQAYLSMIPLMTLCWNLEEGGYDPAAAFERAARAICGNALADTLLADLTLFQDGGLDAIDVAGARALREKYVAFDAPAAREICRWLAGEYTPSPEVMEEFVGVTFD